MNIERRTSNIERRMKAFYRFLLIKKTERSDSILRQSSIVNRQSSFYQSAAGLTPETWYLKSANIR
jgi:hypothetical protein